MRAAWPGVEIAVTDLDIPDLQEVQLPLDLRIGDLPVAQHEDHDVIQQLGSIFFAFCFSDS